MSNNINQNIKFEIELIPNVGLKYIKFGMSRNEVRKIINEMLGEVKLVLRSKDTDCYLRNTLQFTYEEDDTLTFIETAPPPPTFITLLGINTWEIPGNKLLDMLCKFDSLNLEISKISGTSTFQNTHISLWGLDIHYDHIGNYQVPKWGAIAVGDDRYYRKIISLYDDKSNCLK